MTELMQDGRVVDCLLQLEVEGQKEARETLIGHLGQRVRELQAGYGETLVQYWRCVNGCSVPAGLAVCRKCRLTPSGLTLAPPALQVAAVEVGNSGKEQSSTVEPMIISEPQDDVVKQEEVPPPVHPNGSRSERPATPPAPQVVPPAPEEEKKTPRRSPRISQSSSAISTSQLKQPPPVPAASVKKSGRTHPKSDLAAGHVEKVSQQMARPCLECGTLYNYNGRCSKCRKKLEPVEEDKSTSDQKRSSPKPEGLPAEQGPAPEPAKKWRCTYCKTLESNNKCSNCGAKKKQPS